MLDKRRREKEKLTLEDRIKVTQSMLKGVDKMRKTKRNKEGILSCPQTQKRQEKLRYAYNPPQPEGHRTHS